MTLVRAPDLPVTEMSILSSDDLLPYHVCLYSILLSPFLPPHLDPVSKRLPDRLLLMRSEASRQATSARSDEDSRAGPLRTMLISMSILISSRIVPAHILLLVLPTIGKLVLFRIPTIPIPKDSLPNTFTHDTNRLGPKSSYLIFQHRRAPRHLLLGQLRGISRRPLDDVRIAQQHGGQVDVFGRQPAALRAGGRVQKFPELVARVRVDVPGGAGADPRVCADEDAD